MKQTIRNVKKTIRSTLHNDKKAIKTMKHQRNWDVTNCPVIVCLIQNQKKITETTNNKT